MRAFILGQFRRAISLGNAPHSFYSDPCGFLDEGIFARDVGGAVFGEPVRELSLDAAVLLTQTFVVAQQVPEGSHLDCGGVFTDEEMDVCTPVPVNYLAQKEPPRIVGETARAVLHPRRLEVISYRGQILLVGCDKNIDAVFGGQAGNSS